MQLKHGNRDIPLAFDVTGAIEPRSHEAAPSLSISAHGPAALMQLKLLVAAAMRRATGRLDARSRRRRADQGTPGGPFLTDHAPAEDEACRDYASMPGLASDEPPGFEDNAQADADDFHNNDRITGGDLALGSSSPSLLGASG